MRFCVLCLLKLGELLYGKVLSLRLSPDVFGPSHSQWRSGLARCILVGAGRCTIERSNFAWILLENVILLATSVFDTSDVYILRAEFYVLF